MIKVYVSISAFFLYFVTIAHGQEKASAALEAEIANLAEQIGRIGDELNGPLADQFHAILNIPKIDDGFVIYRARLSLRKNSEEGIVDSMVVEAGRREIPIERVLEFRKEMFDTPFGRFAIAKVKTGKKKGSILVRPFILRDEKEKEVRRGVLALNEDGHIQLLNLLRLTYTDQSRKFISAMLKTDTYYYKNSDYESQPVVYDEPIGAKIFETKLEDLLKRFEEIQRQLPQRRELKIPIEIPDNVKQQAIAPLDNISDNANPYR